MLGCSSKPSTATLSPCRTLNTPFGRPASVSSSAIQIAALGSFSLGLSTTVLPVASAIGKNHIGTMAGKLNGLMMATGPSGWRRLNTSTPVETCSLCSPLARCGAPRANSTTSWPRVTSPSASESTLPCSSVMMAASSGLRALSNSRNLKRICWRFAQDMSRQAANASVAALMADSTSVASASTTCLVTTPLAGS